jgi:hypothetical protein
MFQIKYKMHSSLPGASPNAEFNCCFLSSRSKVVNILCDAVTAPRAAERNKHRRQSMLDNNS